MKTKIYIIFIALFLVLQANAQLIDIGLKNEPLGSTTINVYLRPQANRVGTAILSDLVFTVRWPATANLDLSSPTGTFGVGKAGSETKPGNGFEYQKFSSQTLTPLPTNWQTTNEVLIASFNSIPGTAPIHTQGGFRESNTFVIDPFPIIPVGPSGNYYLEMITIGAGDFTGVVYSDAVLPLKIDAFTLKQKSGNQTQINWSTLSESNSSHFEIQRSHDTKLWTTIASVNAAGNSTTKKTYTYLDQHIDLGKVKSRIFYYRIKTVGFDQFISFTETKSIQFGQGTHLTLRNNVVTDRLLVEYDGFAQQIDFKIVDMQGKVVSVYPSKLHEGEGVFDISNGVYRLPAGVYHLVSSSQKEQFPSLRFVKQGN